MAGNVNSTHHKEQVQSPPHRSQVITVTFKQAVLLTCGSSLAQTFPRLPSQWHIMGSLPVTVAGPCRFHTGLPY